eukprot:GFUD01068113.1.p1 GENE.GFUD01068113.1~~GFUD01068113.1.p1  ORF type:complete len:1909 (-),score=640.60 GFUD01068113.1:4-5181(-)
MEAPDDNLNDDDLKDEFVSPRSSTSGTPKKTEPAVLQARTRRRRKSSNGAQQEGGKVKEKVVTCHMCTKQPRESSIYCSEDCIKAHANQALSLLTQGGKTRKDNNPVVVLEPKTNTLLNGPNAPTEGSLQTWLQSHASFHVVMPSKPSSSKFYGGSHQSHHHSKVRTGPKLIAPHRETPDKKTPGPAHRISFMEAIQRQPVKSKEEMVAETKATLRRAISSHESERPAKKERRSSESVERKQQVVRRKQEKVRMEPVEKEVKTPDSKSLRSVVVKGVRDSLLEKLEKCLDLQFEANKILKIAEEIEIAMFGTFGEVGAKYKNKYRSLTYNIKDPKNDGLFRRILLRDLSPIEVVNMSADEFASKELQQWRRQEAKKDIEAIKLHELDMLALGNTYVMKSHKGEQVIEKSQSDAVTEVTSASSDPLLPEDVPLVKDARGKGPAEVTWDHPNHGDLTTEPLCDVCNGKMTLEEFVSAKVSREVGGSGKKKSGDGRRHKDREKHSSSRGHSSSSRDKSQSSSSKEKGHSSTSRDKNRSSKSHSSSSKDKRHSSSSKDKTQSSKSKDRDYSSKSQARSSKDSKSHTSSSQQRHSHSKDQDTAAANLAEAEKADLQARINKATAAIEAAKRSGSELLGQLADTGSSAQEDEAAQAGPGSPEMELDLPDMEMLAGEGSRRHSSGADGEVSSTVTIATPEQGEVETANQEPSVWEGQVIMQDVAKFSVSAYQVSGTSDYLRVDLKSSLTLVGRIPPSVCWDYIDKISKNPTKEILVLRLGPSNNDEKEAYQAFFQYLSTRDRFGVVGNANKLVKDCYIMPLSTTSPVPAALLPLSGQGLPITRPDLLLTILVRTRRNRPGDSSTTTSTAPVATALPLAPLSLVTQAPPPPLPAHRSVASSVRVVEQLVPSLPQEPGSSPYSPPGSSPECPPPLPSSSLQQFASSLSQLPVNMFYRTQDQSTTTLTTILTGVCQGLSLLPQADLSDPTLVTVVAKLSCLVEVLLDTQCDLQEMTGHLTKIVAASPSLCQALSSNLVVVLVKTCRPNYLQLAECLVKLDRKHLDAFKMWVCHEKHSVTEKLWPLVRVVLQSQEFESEKKFITILLKKVVNQVETILTEPGSSDCEQELLDMVSLLSQFSKSDKQLELWKKGVGERMESVEEALKLSANVILLKFRMLATVQKISGGCDSRLMRECFLPLLQQISVSFKLGPLMGSTVLALCSAARECKELVENKMFVKEIGKNPLTWQKFFRSVLKYSLKVGDPGVPALDLLSTICDFLIRGSKLAEVEDIVEMVTSHSLYLGTVLGPSCTTKTALIQLLMSLSPASCTLDQIPLLLSGYMATLHPSDRALLTFLGMHEKAGLDLSQFQPFMFGPVAVQHYAAMAGGAWKQPKVSEVLGILDKDLMRRSCVSLPLSLPLDPQADVGKEAFPDTTLYDPRFILPFLSQLLSPEMYMDKHMKLVDSGALSYAISSLASREWGVRAAGYHVLARVQTAMDTAKLAQEKQVWLHLISLIRNGVASSSNNTSRCVRLSSLVTTFLVRVVDILQTPLSPLYRTISRSILAKPAMDMQAVPEFSRLLNSADIKHTAEQRWVLEIVREGLRDNLDYSLANRSFVCKILQSQWGSVVIDRVGHLQVLDVIERCVGTNYGCTDLLTRHGLLTWLAVVVKRDKVDKLYVKKVVAIVSLALETARNIDKRKQEEKKGVIVEVIRTEMVILVDLIKQFAGQKNDVDM